MKMEGYAGFGRALFLATQKTYITRVLFFDHSGRPIGPFVIQKRSVGEEWGEQVSESGLQPGVPALIPDQTVELHVGLAAQHVFTIAVRLHQSSFERL